MAGQWTARGGWTIEVIRLDGVDCYRVSRRGYVGNGYCYSIEELTRVLGAHDIDLADLTEDDPERK